jgi:protein required for attachment to host cells
MMNTSWVLVANQAEAQIYSGDRRAENLVMVDTLVDKEGTAHSRDLLTEAPGRAFDGVGLARHAMEPKRGVIQEHRRRFVKQMVERLEAGRLKGDFDQLVILAAPAVLGVIRKTLSADLEKIVVKEIPKDVIGQDVKKIRAQLERAFALV